MCRHCVHAHESSARTRAHVACAALRAPRHLVHSVCAALLVPCAAAHAEGFAVAVISYEPGSSPAPGYTNPAAALGEPSRFTPSPWDGGAVTPFQPAWLPSQLVSIGAGGSLVLELDAPATDDPRNPFGIDLIVFGNSFFSDLGAGAGVCGPIAADGGLIEVSPDGLTWCTVPNVAADGLFPTRGYLDASPFDAVPGTVESDARMPVDPAHRAHAMHALAWLEMSAAYGTSAGGAGVDLATTGCATARYVRIRVPPPPHPHVEIDAVSRTRPRAHASDFNGDGAVDGADLTLLLVQYGGPGSADLNGDGTVDGADLSQLLAEWTG
jgi:hypothetical protein